MAAKARDPRRERFWRKAMSRQRASGLGVRAWCRRYGLAETSFHYWRRELVRRDAEPGRRNAPARGAPRRRGASSAPRTTRTPAFVPVTIIPAAAVEVRCPSGHVVSLPAASLASADGGGLRRLFAALALGQRDAAAAGREAPPC